MIVKITDMIIDMNSVSFVHPEDDKLYFYNKYVDSRIFIRTNKICTIIDAIYDGISSGEEFLDLTSLDD